MSMVPEIRLTSDRRYEACIHEAGHAILALLCGDFVEEIAVLPEGATPDGVLKGRKHVTHGAIGVCHIHYATEIALFICQNWDEDEGRYVVDRDARSSIRCYYDQMGGKYTQNKWQRIRAALCSILGGPIAERIHKNEQVDPDSPDDEFTDEFRTENSDISKALAIAEALPRGFIREYDSAWKQTVILLKDPKVWQHVVRLADELSQRGEIRYSWPDNFLGIDMEELLPKGSRRNFPKPPERMNRRSQAQPATV